MIEVSSIIAMALAGLICIALPVVLMALWRKRTEARIVPFYVGAGIFILFALVLEQLLHSVCLLGDNPVARTIQSSTVLYMLYGGLAAGIFEETGRFVAFKLMKRADSPVDAVTYGIGHGGVEAILLVGVNMLIYAALSLLINEFGSTDVGVIGGADGPTSLFVGTSGDALMTTLQSISPTSCFFAVWERAVSILLHIALSVLVFTAVHTRRWWLYPVAILLHAGVDFVAVLYRLGSVQSVLLTEVLITVYTAIVGIFAVRVYQNQIPPQEAPHEVE